MARNINVDVARLSTGHALILGNLPEKIQLEQLNNILLKETHTDIGSFGLFESSSPNYTTYYPEVTAEDLVPKESEFINPVFRALSEVIVHKKYNPIDFGQNGILRPSMKLLQGQTINMDHETMTGNAVGAVSDVEWQDSYVTNNIKIPAGINSVLHIDGKSNPRIARAINQEPPAIHSTSVTVEFHWEQSHPKMDRSEFFSKLGTLDDKGNMYRRVVTKVVRYHEISLVNHGADPFAQLIKKDGKINNPKFAHITYNSAKEEKLVGSSFFFDFKQLGSADWVDNVTDIILNSNTIPIPLKTTKLNNDNQKTKFMDPLLLALAAMLGVTVTQNEDGEIPQEQRTALQAAMQKLQLDKTNAETSLTAEQAAHNTTKTELSTLKAASSELEGLKNFKTSRLEELRAKVVNTCTLAFKGSPTQAILDTIKNTNDYDALSALQATYDTKLEEVAPIVCAACGSKNVSRASAERREGEDESGGGEQEVNLSNEDALKKLHQNKVGAIRSNNSFLGN